MYQVAGSHEASSIDACSCTFRMLETMSWSVLKYGALAVAIPTTLYIGLLGLLTTTFFQSHVVYLHAIQMTWFKDLNVPEIFGFLHNQVTRE